MHPNRRASMASALSNRANLYIPHCFIWFDCCPPFLLLCVAFVVLVLVLVLVLALVFLPGLYSAACRTGLPFLRNLLRRMFFLALRVSVYLLLRISMWLSLFLLFFLLLLVFCSCFCFFVFLFFCLICVPSWRRCLLLATFLPVSLCLLFFSDRPCSRLDLIWFRLSCDHGWIRSGSVNSLQ